MPATCMVGRPMLENFSFSSAYAYMIRDGQIAEMVKDVILAGNLFTTLMNIDAIGNDFEWLQQRRWLRQGRTVPAAGSLGLAAYPHSERGHRRGVGDYGPVKASQNPGRTGRSSRPAKRSHLGGIRSQQAQDQQRHRDPRDGRARGARWPTGLCRFQQPGCRRTVGGERARVGLLWG